MTTYIHFLNQKIDQNKIVLFHPSINAQLPDLLGKNFNFDWNEIVINFYETLNKLLSEFSNKKFILKIKTRDINNIKKYITGSHKNLILDYSTSSLELLKNAKTCIGFNTTALLEAAAFGIPAINFVPDHILNKYSDYIIDYKSLVICTAKYKIIKNNIDKITQRIIFNVQKKNDFQTIVGNSEGNAKKNIVNSILNLVKND